MRQTQFRGHVRPTFHSVLPAIVSQSHTAECRCTCQQTSQEKHRYVDQVFPSYTSLPMRQRPPALHEVLPTTKTSSSTAQSHVMQRFVQYLQPILHESLRAPPRYEREHQYDYSTHESRYTPDGQRRDRPFRQLPLQVYPKHTWAQSRRSLRPTFVDCDPPISTWHLWEQANAKLLLQGPKLDQ